MTHKDDEMMSPDKSTTERVAVLEVQVAELRGAIREISGKESRIEAMLNSLCVNMATLTQKVEDIVRERNIWKNPLIWTNIVSLAVAIYAMSK